MKQLLRNIYEHKYTTIAGVLVAIFTGLLIAGSITVEEWIAAAGGIQTVALFLSKDPDHKTTEKP